MVGRCVVEAVASQVVAAILYHDVAITFAYAVGNVGIVVTDVNETAIYYRIQTIVSLVLIAVETVYSKIVFYSFAHTRAIVGTFKTIDPKIVTAFFAHNFGAVAGISTVADAAAAVVVVDGVRREMVGQLRQTGSPPATVWSRAYLLLD